MMSSAQIDAEVERIRETISRLQERERELDEAVLELRNKLASFKGGLLAVLDDLDRFDKKRGATNPGQGHGK